MSKYSLHVAEWKDCTRCKSCETRKNVVLARGKIPAHIVFVGEAPGESEDTIGTPFVGPAGRLLDHIIEQATGRWKEAGLRIAITNLVGCIPRGGEKVGKIEEPEEESIEACKPRVEQFLEMCQPTIVCAVGKLAKEWLKPGMKHSIKLPKCVRSDAVISITHPSAILRANVAQQGLMVQRAVVEIRQVVVDLLSDELG